MSVSVHSLMLIVRGLEFQRRMSDAELFFEPSLNRFLDLIKVIPTVACDHHMRVECRSVFMHLPEMHMMQFLDTIHSLDSRDHGIGVDIRRAA